MPKVNMLNRAKRLRVLSMGAWALAVVSCSEPIVDPATVAPIPLELAVTGEAKNSITPEGLFQLPPPPTSLHGRELISGDRAKELATAYVRSVAFSLRGSWERIRGAPIDVDALAPENRVFFAESVHGPLPESAGITAHRRYGPYYLVTFRNGSDRALQVAVSALNTDVSINARGHIVVPQQNGAEFLSLGIPVGVQHLQGVGPEEIAELVAGATGARVASVPRLILAPGLAPQHAIWWLELEGPVEVVERRSGSRILTSRIGTSVKVVDRSRGTYEWVHLAPKAVQPSSQEITYLSALIPPITRENAIPERVTINLPIASDAIVAWDTITASLGGGAL